MSSNDIWTLNCPRSPISKFQRLVHVPPKEPTFFQWWLTSGDYSTQMFRLYPKFDSPIRCGFFAALFFAFLRWVSWPCSRGLAQRSPWKLRHKKLFWVKDIEKYKHNLSQKSPNIISKMRLMFINFIELAKKSCYKTPQATPWVTSDSPTKITSQATSVCSTWPRHPHHVPQRTRKKTS